MSSEALVRTAVAPEPAPALRLPAPLVAMAASAGGIPALQTVLSALPASFPGAILLVLHRRATRTHVLQRILQGATAMRVRDAESGEPIVRGTVYLAPADRHLTITSEGKLETRDGSRESFVLSSADPLFRSAAAVAGNAAIAVVLTGSGRNGARGVQAVKEMGGIVIAQDQPTSAHFAMPAAAISTGCVDMILPLQSIGQMLNELARQFDPEHSQPGVGK